MVAQEGGAIGDVIEGEWSIFLPIVVKFSGAMVMKPITDFSDKGGYVSPVTFKQQYNLFLN